MEKIAMDMRPTHTKRGEHSKLVMKSKTTGRKSVSSIHCIPQFSQVPSKRMSEAQKALQQKIKAKSLEDSHKLQQNIYPPVDSDHFYRDMSSSAINRPNKSSSTSYYEFPLPELTIEPIRSRPEASQWKFKAEEGDGSCDSDTPPPEITIIPKYPQLIVPEQVPSMLTESLISSTMNNLILRKDDFEKLLPTNPIYSTYVFLPRLNVFVHPLAVPSQILSNPSHLHGDNGDDMFRNQTSKRKRKL